MNEDIEALRTRFRLARQLLRTLGAEWLDTQLISNDIKKQWLSIISNANSSDDLHTLLMESEIPFVSTIHQVNALLTEGCTKNNDPNWHLSNYFIVNAYDCNHSNPVLKSLCYLTNIFEQLLVLDQVSTPIILDEKVFFKPLELALLMAQNISKELRLAEHGPETLSTYQDRMLKAQIQLQIGKKNNLDHFRLIDNQLEYNFKRCNYSLGRLALLLSECFGFEKDDRYFVRLWGVRLRSYIPWQNLIKQLANTLYSEAWVEYPDRDQLSISESRIKYILLMMRTQSLNPINLVKKRSDAQVESANEEIGMISRRLHSISSQLDSRVLIDKSRSIVTSFLNQPISLITFFRVFNTFSVLQKKSNEDIEEDDIPLNYVSYK